MFVTIPATVFRDGSFRELNEEQEKLKREIYDKMNPRRRKFVDRIGYASWDPFQQPNEPLDLRTDISRRATGQLVNEFLRDAAQKGRRGDDYAKGALECALGVVNRDEKYMGIFEFCLWYHELLKKEGHTA